MWVMTSFLRREPNPSESPFLREIEGIFNAKAPIPGLLKHVDGVSSAEP
jgi:hypothetical protein